MTREISTHNVGGKVVKMKDMKPCQVGRIIDNSKYEGHLVMRNADPNLIEVINITDAGPGKCWVGNHLENFVRLLQPNEVVTVEFYNSVGR